VSSPNELQSRNWWIDPRLVARNSSSCVVPLVEHPSSEAGKPAPAGDAT
jgi:hypothetical protein